MEHKLVAIASILLTWLVIAPVLSGVGLLLRRSYGLRPIRSEDVLVAFWVGFAAVLAIGQIWHLFWAADYRVWLIALPPAAGGIVWCRHELWSWLTAIRRAPLVLTCVAAVLLLSAAKIALQSSQGVAIHDTGSYHLPATLWSHAYPAVPGLSNLHSRLGFNSSLFVYAATLSEGIWSGRPQHVVIGPLLWCTLVLSVVSATRVYFSRSPRAASLLAVSFIAPTIYLLSGGHATSLSPNAAAVVLLLVAAWQAVVALTSDEADAQTTRYAAFCAALLLAATTTLKLTVAPFALCTWLLIAWRFGWREAPSGTARFKSAAWIVLSASLLVVPWLARSVVLSGYPMYPMAIAGVAVEWRVPEEQARIETEWTRASARRTLERPARGMEWVGHWATRLHKRGGVGGVMVPALLSIGAGLVVVAVLRRRGWANCERNEGAALWLVWLLLLAIAVWFATAPDPRFGAGIFWLLAGLVGAVALVLVWRWGARTVKLAILLGAVVLALSDASFIESRLLQASRLPAARIASGTLGERLDRGLVPTGSVALESYVTRSGLRVLVPLEGNQIWAAPLLSTPHPSPNLALRDPRDLSAGFVSDGPWAPSGYPNLTHGFHEYVSDRLAGRSSR